MNGKLAKKTRREARKLFTNQVQKTAEEVGRSIGNALRPKPRWVPQFIWLRLLGIFIIIRR